MIAAGTGLGEALLLNVDGRFVPGESEGGHADFAARTPRELDLVRELTRIFGRVSVEHVLSGAGLVNLYQFTHDSFGTEPMVTPHSIAPARLVRGGRRGGGRLGAAGADQPARRWTGGASDARRRSRCSSSAYGAEAGNIALRAVATAGVYVGGGIAPKILPALESGAFLEAFRAKEPMAHLVATIPVAVILNPDAGLLGAASYAQDLSLKA